MRRVLRLAILFPAVLILVAGGLYLALKVSPAETCPLEPAEVNGAWSTASPMPTDRSEIAAAVLDGKIYVAGGLRLSGASSAFEVYDLEAGRWAAAAPLPHGLHHASMAAVGGQIFLTGGFEGNTLSHASDALWIYDPGEDAWARDRAMPGGRAAHASAVIDGRLYVVGGVGVGSTFIWVYDPATGSWTTQPALLPTPREHLAAVALDGKLYAIGGRDPETQDNLATVEFYDPALGTWASAPDLPTARGGLTASVVGDRIHVTGGEDFKRRPNCTFAQHELFDPGSNAWRAAARLPTARHGLASVEHDGRWYVIGGGARASAMTIVSTLDLVEVYRP